MARGNSLRASEGAAAPAAKAPDPQYLLENRLARLAETAKETKRWIARATLMGAKKSQIKDAQNMLAAYEHALEKYSRLVEAVKAGDNSGMLPNDKDDLNDEGAKALAFQALRKAGIKVGPSKQELGDEGIEKLLNIGSPNEYSVQFDKDGNFRYGFKGKGDEVGGSWPQEVGTGPRGYINYLGEEFHTHPVVGKANRDFGGPPSPEDIHRLILTGIAKSTIVTPEGRYVLEMPKEIRDRVSAAYKDQKGIMKLANDMMMDWNRAWSQAEQDSLGWESDKEQFGNMLSNLEREANRGALGGGVVTLKFIPSKGFEDMAFETKRRELPQKKQG